MSTAGDDRLVELQEELDHLTMLVGSTTNPRVRERLLRRRRQVNVALHRRRQDASAP